MQDTTQTTDTTALRARSLELLDFPAVREQLARYATFPPARELALQLTPSWETYEVDELQHETSEGLLLMERSGRVSLDASGDPLPGVTRAALGGTLTGLELLAIADALEVQRRARSAVLRERDHVPTLASIAELIPDLQELQRQVRGCIGPRGDVLDSATPTLGALRRQVREAYHRVTQALTRLMQSPGAQEALQDQVISLRGDRLVVQVKAEMRHRIPGIVLDASNTGATLFIEPFVTVEACNAWRELALEEEREVQRVLRELSGLVGALAEDIKLGIELTARLDFILARAEYSAALRGVLVSRGGARPAPAEVKLANARHPLLGRGAVPISVTIGPGWSVLVITGPNTGGKTVAMKTVGLLALMHQSGLRVPADEGSSLPVFDGIYADVGDEQSIQQSVSTFSSHMPNVIAILSQATTSSLVLLDELGTSTDPEEGSALAKAILQHLAEQGITTIATTHHRSVAAHAEATPGMMNASVSLDPDSLRPTFHLTIGVPGRSYAMAVAARMGLPATILEKARSLLEPQYLRFEDWLSELQKERQQLQLRLEEAEEAQARAEATRRDLEAQLEELAQHREEMLDDMRRDLLAQYDEVRRKLHRAESALSWSPTPATSEEVAKAREALASARRELEAVERRRPQRLARASEQRPIAVGDTVSVRGLNLRGTVVSIPAQGKEAEVNIGKVRMRLDMGRLSRVEEAEAGHEGPEVSVQLGPGLPSTELDLRGLRVEEALARLEEFLDRAVRDGLSSVRVIHGKGTGALRQAVRAHLARHPLARAFSPEARERGGEGATVVQLA